MKPLAKRYQDVIPELKKELAIANLWELPRIQKVSLNVGIGSIRGNTDRVEAITKALSKIAGQAPAKTASKKSIAGFKVREGDIVGLRVTLRGRKMADFIDRLIAINLPRQRDFSGLTPDQFDKQGNLTLGFKDHAIFYELTGDYFETPFGLSVTISISHSNPQKSLTLLQQLGFPINKG